MPWSAAESLYAPQRFQCLTVVENFPGHMTGVSSPDEIQHKENILVREVISVKLGFYVILFYFFIFFKQLKETFEC